MRKVVLIISIIFVTLLTITLTISLTKNVTNKLKVVSIPKSYCYKYSDTKRIALEIYLNDEDNIIMNSSDNTYKLVNGNSYFQLCNVVVEIEYNCNYENEEFYKYTIFSDMLDLGNINISNCYLEISNDSFTVLIKLGSFVIYKNDYEELKFSELYGNYSYINEELYLVGITITLDQSYHKIYSLSIGEGFGNLEYIECDIYKDNELEVYELAHPRLDNKKRYDGIELNAIYNTYFIPISYQDDYLITNSAIIVDIDHKKYYIDNFQYVITNVLMSNYINLEIGEISYA